MPDHDDADPEWDALLAWLASHGMDTSPHVVAVKRVYRPGAGYGLVASRSCQPRSLLFTVPATALMNIRTLAPYYTWTLAQSNAALSATQILSLHLSMHRQKPSADTYFGPYISILPRDFAFHPLTWHLHHQEGQSIEREDLLLAHLPPRISHDLEMIAARFRVDLEAAKTYLVSEGHHGLVWEDFLWGWLNVNTRCLYYRVKPDRSDADNLTLCPILDFANHANPDRPCMVPLLPANAHHGGSNPKGDFALLSPDVFVKEGTEICLTYGPHSNRKLFVEYGFIDARHPDDGLGTILREVDIQDLLEDLLKSHRLYDEIKKILTSEGYWGDWTIHASADQSAFPSFRVVSALRLYHVVLGCKTEVISELELLEWKNTLYGISEVVSETNETAWKDTLATMCDAIAQRAQESLCRLEHVDDEWAWGVRALWKEEKLVARLVADCIRSGKE